MYARVGQAKVKAGKLDEFVECFKAEVVPQHKQRQGAKGITVLTDPASNSVFLISFWATEADARAVAQNPPPLHSQAGGVGELLEAPPVVQLLWVPINEA